VLKATSICMNCVVVCVCVYVITKTHDAKLSTCKSDQKFKLKLKFLPNAVASNDDDDVDDVCNSPAPNFTHFQPHPQAIENSHKPKNNNSSIKNALQNLSLRHEKLMKAKRKKHKFS